MPAGFLIDENLPLPLRLRLSGEVVHARELGESCTDSHLWTVATERRWVLVTKDADFHDRMLLSSPPPWVVKLECGNLRKQELLALVDEKWPDVEKLLPEHKLIRVFTDAVEGIA